MTNAPMLQKKIDQVEATLNEEVQGLRKHGSDNIEETYAKSILGNTLKMQSGEQKILGVRWNVVTDSFVFNLEDIACLAKDIKPTKRHVVSIVGRFFDPIGFLSPIVIRFKMLFQELCESKLDWDEMLSGKLLKKWHSLTADLQESQPVSIPRCYFSGVHQEVKSYKLVGFCDASVGAYAAVVYLLIKTDTSHFVNFVASKTRVSPVQGQSLPRLELLSTLLLAKLMTSVTQCLELELPLIQSTCFTDSKVAFYWISGLHKEWKPFIQNRVNEIRRLLPVNCWRHCPGVDNPADIPSRGLSPLDLSVSKLWRDGPNWLSDVALDDGHCNSEVLMPEECIVEMKAKDRKENCAGLLTTEKVGISQVINMEKYSSLDRLLRVTTHVLKFICKLGHPRQLETIPPLIAKAEVLWIQGAQVSLTTDANFQSWKRQLGLFLDPTGVWRCGGRLSNADIAYSAKHPVILPRHHAFTVLVVQRAHERVLHDGVKETLTELRTRYWIIQGRSFVKQLIHHCVICRRLEALPYCAPPPPPLPSFRVTEEPPFTFTGVDFAGPLHVKLDAQTRCSDKVWICLYTCCVTRAIHLDIVPNLTAQSFIRCFKRFVARRGLPSKIVSDNGKTFTAAAKIIKKIMSNENVVRHLAGVRVEWTFNIARAPWWGGVFERMVKSTKRCLRKMIGQAKLTYDELLTAVTEVEMIVNSRPLSYVSPDDLEEPLTPSHLLMGRRVLSLPDNLCYDRDEDYNPETTPTLLSKRMKYLSNVLDRFWKRWRTEYLSELRESHRTVKRTHGTTRIAVGDIVVVHNEGKRRGFWSLGKVEETLPGKDGLIRGAIIRVYTGGRRSKLLRRPIQRLYPLEVNCLRDATEPLNPQKPQSGSQSSLQSHSSPEESHSSPEESHSSPEESHSSPEESHSSPEESHSSLKETRVSRRPRRAAAVEARDRIVAQTLNY